MEGKEALFLVGMGVHRLNLVAGGGDGITQRLLVQGPLREDHRLALGVGGRDLLDGELVSDGVVDVAFTHTAGHAVHLQDGFCHGDISF